MYSKPRALRIFFLTRTLPRLRFRHITTGFSKKELPEKSPAHTIPARKNTQQPWYKVGDRIFAPFTNFVSDLPMYLLNHGDVH